MNPKHPLSTITIYRLVASFILAISIYSCANMSRPGGGPRDETPPVFIKSMPVPNALNVSKQKVEIEFDEIIQVDKPSEKVIVSPPQKDMPEIRTSGRKITVILKDSLLPNTTYTIDFSDAIIDNNERNPLYGFAYSFSTGPKIDSLQVSGILLNARDLEPITGMLVGLHSDLEDSAFQKLPLERIASSDELGHFTIRNVTPGKYRLFALKDMNRDYRFDNPSEDIAFLDSIVIPSADVKLHVDTIWKDSVTIDTIIEYNHTHFYPNDILLTAFNEGFQSQYLDKSERKDRRKIDLYFKAPADSLPKLKPLNFEQEDWAILERSFHNDTLQYWIKDSLIYNMDTLLFTAEYFRTDTLRQLSLYNDTLKFIMKKVKAPKKKEKKKDKDNDSIEVPEISMFINRFVFPLPNHCKHTMQGKYIWNKKETPCGYLLPTPCTHSSKTPLLSGTTHSPTNGLRENPIASLWTPRHSPIFTDYSRTPINKNSKSKPSKITPTCISLFRAYPIPLLSKFSIQETNP